MLNIDKFVEITKQNGMKVEYNKDKGGFMDIGNGTRIRNCNIVNNEINGVEIPKKSKNICCVNNNIFVDGKQYINGRWKTTLRAIFHLFF